MSIEFQSWCQWTVCGVSLHETDNGATATSYLFCSLAVLDPRVGHTTDILSIYPCPLSFWLTLPRGVLSTSWRCPSRPCVVFLAFVHLALFLALSLSPRNSLVSSWCDHSMPASLLWRCLTVPSLLQLFKNPLIWFLSDPQNPQNHSQSFHLKGVKACFFILFDSPALTVVRCYRPH